MAKIVHMRIVRVEPDVWAYSTGRLCYHVEMAGVFLPLTQESSRDRDPEHLPRENAQVNGR